MNKKETMNTASEIIGIATACLSNAYLPRLLKTVLIPESIGLKIGMSVLSSVISIWVGQRVEKDLKEFTNGICDAIDEYKKNKKVVEETDSEITATVTE